jgi:hypothetical protein
VKASAHRVLAAAAAAILCFSAAACGNSVSGHTYQGPGGIVQIQFGSGGKATATMGAMTENCTYTQKDTTVSLTCEGIATSLTVNSDGSLSGPPDGMLSKLTRVK